jgi:glutamyl-tRNA(Gln) amidotransferase subunit D
MSGARESDGGYRGPALEVLREHGVRVWSDAEVRTTRGRFRGIVLPRSQSADDRHVVLKLDSGYNVGLAAERILSMREHGRREGVEYAIPQTSAPRRPGLPSVKLLGTGGTIASRLDYRTGAVVPAFSPAELYSTVPELAEICNLETEKVYGVLSENMGPEHWIGLAEAIGREIESGVDGIVVGHGTDTMHHTSAALSFMVQETPVPIVMVGSQRSSDRPSSDAAPNLIHATKAAAESDIAEVLVCMMGPTSDEYGLLHRGTRVRKMHSSTRSTFRTIGDIPVAMVDRESGVQMLREDHRRRDPDRKPVLTPVFEEKVALLYYVPSMRPVMVDALVDAGYRGIVFAGTGLGHINRELYPAVRRAAEAGLALYMTVQTLWGYTQMYVYETGREIMDLGVVPAANMLPEIAWVKLGWALGQTDDLDEVRRIMLTPVAGEITAREPYDGYIVLQGGIPEVEEFVRGSGAR